MIIDANRRLSNLRCALPGLLIAAAIGCASKDVYVADRKTAYEAYDAGLTAFAAKDFPTADAKFTIAIDAGVLNPDFYCFAVTKRALCWAVAGKYDEALAELDKLGAGASNPDEVLIARSYIYKKQGKLAEANAALAKARQYNRTIKEVQ